MTTRELAALLDRLRAEPRESEWLEFKATRCEPRFDVHTFNYEGKRVVLFEVHPAFDQPVKFYGTAYIRDGSSKTELEKYPRKQRQIWQRRIDWSALVCERATLADLDPAAIVKARLEYKTKFPARVAEVDAWDDATFLNKAKLTIQGAITQSGLVEGRYPNLVVSAEVAAVSGEKAKYVRDSGFDGQYYRDLVVKLVRKHQPVSREDIDQLLLNKLPEILSREQKLNRIHNLLRQLTTGGRIHNEGSRRFPKWVLASDENNQ